MKLNQHQQEFRNQFPFGINGIERQLRYLTLDVLEGAIGASEDPEVLLTTLLAVVEILPESVPLQDATAAIRQLRESSRSFRETAERLAK